MNISFINRISIITDNAFGSRELGNPYLSTLIAPGSPHPSIPGIPSSFCSYVSIMSGSLCPSAPIESSNPSNSMADFLIDVLANPFSNFGVDAFSDLTVDSMPSLAVASFSNLPTLDWFLRKDFFALAADTLSTFGRNVLSNYSSSTGHPLPLFLLLVNFKTSEYPDYSPSAGCLFPPFLLPPSDFTTSKHPSRPSCPLLPSLPLLSYSTAFSTLSQDVPLDYLPSLGSFSLLLSLGDSTYDW